MDLISADTEISLLKQVLREYQEGIAQKHRDMHEKAALMGEAIAIEPKCPRVVGRQVYRDNALASNPEDYYRVSLTNPFLAHVLQQLQTRFSREAVSCCKAFKVMPSYLVNHLSEWKDSVRSICQEYSGDIPNPEGLEAELDLWESKWVAEQARGTQLPQSVTEALCHLNSVAYPNLHTLLRLLGTIPVTTCSCERSISSLRRLKTYLRSTMGQDRLNGLALMHANKHLDINIDEVVALFGTRHPRRMRLPSMLSLE